MSNASRLAEILNKSKAVMHKAEENHGSTTMNMGGGNMVSSQEKEVPNLTENFIKRNSPGATRSVAPKGGNYRNASTSKMPKAVLEAMINNPIEIPESPNHTFELQDLEGLIEETPSPQPTYTSSNEEHIPTNAQSIREIVREEIGDVVREVVEEYLDKSLVTEDIKIKIGNTIFGGKLKPIPTKNKTKKRV